VGIAFLNLLVWLTLPPPANYPLNRSSRKTILISKRSTNAGRKRTAGNATSPDFRYNGASLTFQEKKRRLPG